MNTHRMMLAAFLSAALLNGCAALGLGAAGGYIAADEAAEDDGEFDPLEKVTDPDDDDGDND